MAKTGSRAHDVPDLLSADRDAMRPLAERMRPRTLDEMVGQKRLLAPGSALRLDRSRDGGMAALRVRDQGDGIPAQLHDAVFERFFRVSTADDGGSGLGLPIVRAIARRAGGDARVEPSDRGCVILLTLPLAAADAPSGRKS